MISSSSAATRLRSPAICTLPGEACTISASWARVCARSRARRPTTSNTAVDSRRESVTDSRLRFG